MGLISKASELEQKRISLESEIDLVRATLIRVSEVWSLVLEAKGSEEQLLFAERIIREAADCVARLVQAAARVRILDQGALQMTSVSWVVGEVTRAIDEVVREKCGDDVAEQLVSRIKKIKLPEDETLAKFIKQQSNEQFL